MSQRCQDRSTHPSTHIRRPNLPVIDLRRSDTVEAGSRKQEAGSRKQEAGSSYLPVAVLLQLLLLPPSAAAIESGSGCVLQNY